MTMRPGLALLGTLLAAVVLASPASASVCTKGTTSWTNPNGGGWKTEANWSNGLPSKACDAKITLAGDYGVVVGSRTGAGGVARSLVIGGASGHQNLVDDNSTCGAPSCDSFDSRLVVGAGGIKVNATGAIKMYGGRVASIGAVRLTSGRMYGAGTVEARRGVYNTGGLLVLDGNGVITIEGAYTQDARSTMSIGVPPEGSADLPGGLAVSGMLSIDGKLRVDGAAPARTAPFPVLVTGKGLFGAFADTSFDDQEYATIFDAKGMKLGPVPAKPDTTKPVLSKVRLKPSIVVKQAELSLTTSEASKIDIEFSRYGSVQPVSVRVVTAKAGANTYRLTAKPLGLKPGRYRMALHAVDVAGNRSDPLSLTFVVRQS